MYARPHVAVTLLLTGWHVHAARAADTVNNSVIDNDKLASLTLLLTCWHVHQERLTLLLTTWHVHQERLTLLLTSWHVQQDRHTQEGCS